MGKIVILGANGFIGQHLVERLASYETNTIIAFDRFSSYQTGKDHPFERLPNVILVPGNFYNRAELSEVLEGADYVFHLISSTNPATAESDPLIDIETNIKSSVELFELCSEQNVGKVIFLSSGGTVYGEINNDRISELSLPAPRSPYGIGKLTIEHYLRYFKKRAGLDYVVYRVANPYGPGQHLHSKQGVIPIFLYHFLIKDPITIYGDGEMIRDYIYISDLIDMIVGSFSKENKFSEYNIGSGMGSSINDLVRYIESCTGYQVEKKFNPTPTTYIQKSVLDINRFTKEFNISPSVDLEEGIRRTWQYVKKASQ